MERRAEMAVDDRFKAKHESIKAYFDSTITKILLNGPSNNNNDKIVEFGREILALKLVIQKLETEFLAE